MRNTARTTAKSLLIAVGAAGFVALGSGFAAADTVGDLTGAPGTDALGWAPAVDPALPAPALPEVDTALPAPALPEVAVPEVDGVVGDARDRVDVPGVTVPRVDVPEIDVPEVDVDGHLATVRGATLLVDFVALQTRGDVDAVTAEARTVVDRTAQGVPTDLDGVDDLASDAVTDVTDGVDDAVEDLDVPATDVVDTGVVDTEDLPRTPELGGVEHTVDGLTKVDALAETEVLPTDSLDTDVVDTDLVDDATDVLDTDPTDGLL
ncbi:hypothetical protein [Nocardiopsis sp. MG754419]|uniref:hypothetical protein n=1 Tax=Nocardiopsis sp. MG754419 TaxID=2259865 RepID=UPI001BA4B077|nr:hypothetical protein [Nocardiopsis sp. MG754419]MBR8741088.1 hypothetical protein [Nocardiopsis sp. MG754419]